jgi:hypothetical protein
MPDVAAPWDGCGISDAVLDAGISPDFDISMMNLCEFL